MVYQKNIVAEKDFGFEWIVNQFFTRDKLLLSQSEEDELCALYEQKMALDELNTAITNSYINPALN